MGSGEKKNGKGKGRRSVGLVLKVCKNCCIAEVMLVFRGWNACSWHFGSDDFIDNFKI